MSDPIHEIQRIFAPGGPLAAAVPGFRPRPQQLEMAQRIAAAIAGNLALVTEAGTGTGKTFAYLVPALLSGGKVIVSTGTKTLQDQLFNRDLPTVRAALKVGATIALLTGRIRLVRSMAVLPSLFGAGLRAGSRFQATVDQYFFRKTLAFS